MITTRAPEADNPWANAGPSPPRPAGDERNLSAQIPLVDVLVEHWTTMAGRRKPHKSCVGEVGSGGTTQPRHDRGVPGHPDRRSIPDR